MFFVICKGMDFVEEAFARFHQEILDGNYNWPPGSGFRNCTDFAGDLLGLLLDAGKSPSEIVVADPARTYIYPLRFPEAHWWWHVSAAVGDVVYDPIFERPVEISSYTRWLLKPSPTIQVWRQFPGSFERVRLQ